MSISKNTIQKLVRIMSDKPCCFDTVKKSFVIPIISGLRFLSWLAA
jgi:hypothetical protein